MNVSVLSSDAAMETSLSKEASNSYAQLEEVYSSSRHSDDLNTALLVSPHDNAMTHYRVEILLWRIMWPDC